jgi:hypothetical protein
MQRSEAIRLAYSYRRTAGWHRHRDATGEEPGRRPRWRKAARELSDLRCAKVREAWTLARGDLEFFVAIAEVRLRRALEVAGGMVLEILAPTAAARALERHRERLEQLASDALDGRPRVRLSVESQ